MVLAIRADFINKSSLYKLMPHVIREVVVLHCVYRHGLIQLDYEEETDQYTSPHLSAGCLSGVLFFHSIWLHRV